MADEARDGRRDAPSGNGDDWLSALTPREREVLMRYVKCQNAKRVAYQLGTRPQTVKNQLSNIGHKLGVDSREGLLVYALTHMRH